MRLPSLSLIALSLLSASSYAVENGSPVDWQQYNDAVRLENPTGGNCTATLIAGHYAITAGHCLEETGIDRLITNDGNTILLSNQWLSQNTLTNTDAEQKTSALFALMTLLIIVISNF